MKELDENLVEDVVVSSRIRIARNVEKYKFPEKISIEESDKLTQEILDALKDSEDIYEFYRMRDLSNMDKHVFVEKHLISPSLLHSVEKSSFLLREDEKVTIMINEEDHIRIQVLLSGFNIDEAWKICSKIDDLIEKKIDYAFHEKFGYLTSCPTNVGTGLRASVMVHLPCIAMVGQLNIMMEDLRRIGLTIRGIYGEGSEGLGNLYQISNQTTLGQEEKNIIKKLNKIVRQIVNRERDTRKYLMDKNNLELEDKIFRSLGILKYSKIISSKEAMFHLSNVKLGSDMGIIENVPSKNIIKIMDKIQPAIIQKNIKEAINISEINEERSKIIKEELIKMEG